MYLREKSILTVFTDESLVAPRLSSSSTQETHHQRTVKHAWWR